MGARVIALRPVMILDDEGLERLDESEVELGAFVHVDDVAEATVLAVGADPVGHRTRHHRMTLCGPGEFDTSRARRLPGWTARRRWPS